MPAVRSDAAESRRIAIFPRTSTVRRRHGVAVFFGSCSKRALSVEYGAQLGRIDVPARDYTDDVALAALSGQGGGHGRGAGCLGDDMMPAGEQTNRLGDLTERGACRVIHHAVNQRPHLLEHRRAAHSVDETLT